jgi:dihydroflavonol-4-reductase
MPQVAERALVTGANGFVGCHLVAHLLERGYRVRGLVRTTSDLSALAGRPFELAYGDVTEPDTLPAALDGVDLVFHVAGLTKSRDRAAYFRVNEAGSRALMEACHGRPALRRFVYVSSQAAAGPSGPERPRREEDPPAPTGPYGESKLAGERACLEAAAGRIPLTVVRPAIVYGPWERDMLQLFRQARRGLVPRIRGDSLVSLIHAADLAELLERAGRSPAAVGRTYFAADHRSYWMREVIALMGEVLGRRVVQLPIPPAVLWPLAVVNEQLLALGRGIEALTRTRLKEYRERFWSLDTARCRTDLDWEPGRSLKEGLAETARWYRGQGWL